MKRQFLSFWLGLVGLLILVLAMGCGRRETAQAASNHEEHDEHEEGGPIELDAETVALLGLETVEVGTENLSTRIVTTGKIIANEDHVVKIGPRVSGRIVEARVKIGDGVKAGDVIATLDSVDLAQALAAYREAEARLDLAQKNLERQRKFAAAGAFTQEPLEKARKEYAEAKLELAEAQTKLIQAENEVELAENELERTRRLAEMGTFTTALVEAKRQDLVDAQNELSTAEEELAQAESELQLAQSELARIQRLAETGTYTTAAVEEKRQALADAETEWATAQSELGQAENELQLARNELARIQRLAETGTYTTAAVEEKRQDLADAEKELSEAQAEEAKARAEVKFAQGELARTRKLAEIGELTRDPLEAAENEHAAAQSQQLQAQATLHQAEIDLARVERLYKEGVAAKKELLAAQTAVKETQAALQEAQTRTRTAQAHLERQRKVVQENITAEQAIAEKKRALAQAQKQQQMAVAHVRQLTMKVANARSLLQREETAAREGIGAKSAVQQAQTRVAQAQKVQQQATAHVRELATKVEAARSALQREEIAAGEDIGAKSAVQQSQTRVAHAEQAQQRAASQVAELREKVKTAQSLLAREQTTAQEGLGAKSAVQRAETRVAQAQKTRDGERAHVRQAEEQVRIAQQVLAREQKLYEAQLRAQQELQVAENEMAAAKINRDSAAEAVQLLGIAPGRPARRSGGQTIVPLRTPRGGVVIARNMNVGEMVGPETALATVLDLRTVYLEADVYEKDFDRVQAGQLVYARVTAFPDKEFRGQIIFVSGAVDETTRTAKIRALLDNPTGQLRPEMFATVVISVGEGEPVLAVPRSAVQETEEGPTVYVQTEPYTYESRPVLTGIEVDDRVEIKRGLGPGEVVVKNGFLLRSEQAKSGMVVHAH